MASGSGVRSRAGALLWVGCLQFFLVEQMAQLRWRGHYSFRFNYISDLGTAGSPLHGVMNASFLLQGVLIAGGALMLPGFTSPRVAGALARGCLLLAGAGVALVGWAPEDGDTNLHIAGARAHFLFGALAMTLWGASLASRRRSAGQGRHAAAVAFAAGGLAIAGDLLLLFPAGPLGSVLGGGGIERLAAYPLPLWLALTGFRLLRAGPARGDL